MIGLPVDDMRAVDIRLVCIKQCCRFTSAYTKQVKLHSDRRALEALERCLLKTSNTASSFGYGDNTVQGETIVHNRNAFFLALIPRNPEVF